jgi:hypothetical protein
MLELNMLPCTILQFLKDPLVRRVRLEQRVQRVLQVQHHLHLSELLLLEIQVEPRLFQTLALSMQLFMILQFLKGQLAHKVTKE